MTTHHEPQWAAEERDKMTAELRRRINWQYKGRCVVCGTRDKPHIDHIVPISLGGKSIPSNLWVLCAKHNTQKGAQWPIYWAMELIDDRYQCDEHVPNWRYEPKGPKPEATTPLWSDEYAGQALDLIDNAIAECGIEYPNEAEWSD